MTTTAHTATDTPPPETRASGTSAPRAPRADIQGLRALAVGLVVLYHFWPQRLTGGYVGVDVFFVISGFLITTHLLERPPGRPRDLAEFWGRRIRRLLPAAILVILVTLAVTWLVAPETLWRSSAVQGLASATYVQNWVLAREAVDYLAADNTATAVQHYWSLSIEEQFYLVWPVLILLTTWLAGRVGIDRRIAAGGAIGAVFGLSLAYSILTTAQDPAAYFLSYARFWELAAGGLVALLAPRLAGLGLGAARVVAVWGGLALVMYAAITFDGATVFPGSAALIPVVGTALVILADVGPGPGSPLWLMRRGAVRVAGDASYSVYLWHWPFVVLVPYAIGHPMAWPAKVAAIVAVVLLAILTKNLVEEPLRGRRPLGLPLRRSFVFALAGALVVAVGSFGLFGAAGGQKPSELPTDAACFGGRAAVDPGCDVRGSELFTDPVSALEDKPAVYRRDCISGGAFDRKATCTFGGSEDPALRVALIGNSHAGQYLPVLQDIARSENWQITTYLAYECHTSDRVISFPEADRTAGCKAWNDWAVDEVETGDFDLVVSTNRTQRPVRGLDGSKNETATRAAYARVMKRWVNSGADLLVVRDNPRRGSDDSTAPDCVAQNIDNPTACDKPLAEAEVWDPQHAAAAALADARHGSVATFDPTPYICPEDRCRSVVGGVIVWWDTNHLTTAFARSLTKDFRQALEPLSPAG